MKRRNFLHRLGLTSVIPLIAGVAAGGERRVAPQSVVTVENYIDEHLRSLEVDSDSEQLFRKLESKFSGVRVDLRGGRFRVKNVPTANLYVNGVFLTDAGEIEAAESAGMIAAKDDTGAVEQAYRGGRKRTGSISGRSTFYNKVIIASTNCRALFARSVVIASIYTWVKSNLGLAAASRQCIVNGPQASTISAEESKSYGFRAFNYGAIFSSATVSTGGNIATRHAETSGSYVLNLASNTTRIGSGYGAELKVYVTGGKVSKIEVVKPGKGYRLKESRLEVEDRGGRGRGCEAKLRLGKGGSVESIIVVNSGKNYGQDTEALIIQNIEASAIIASSRSELFGCSNSLILSSVKSRVSNSLATVIGSYKSSAKSERSTVIGSVESHAVGSGSIVLGGSRNTAAASGAIVFGERVFSDSPNSLSFGFAPSGKRTSENLKFRVDSGGCVYSAAGFKGAGDARGVAEMFENFNRGEIPIGCIVTEREGKVAICKAEETMFGVKSNFTLLVGGGADFHWAGKYLCDEFGRVLYEDIKMIRYFDSESRVIYEGAKDNIERRQLLRGQRTEDYLMKVPKLNPYYDDSVKYVPRSERPDEWSCIVYSGTVRVRVTERVKPGDYLNAIEGIGDVSDDKTGLRCLKIITEFEGGRGYAVADCFLR